MYIHISLGMKSTSGHQYRVPLKEHATRAWILTVSDMAHQLIPLILEFTSCKHRQSLHNTRLQLIAKFWFNVEMYDT